MGRTLEYAFILWANLFEEMLAVVFATELRRVGLSVKVVGLRHRRTPGAYGLALMPDITLEDAIHRAHEAICVIVPCDESGMKQLEGDPRLNDFFYQAQANNAIFIFGQVRESTLSTSNLILSDANNMIVHPDREDLVGFARKVAHSLVKVL